MEDRSSMMPIIWKILRNVKILFELSAKNKISMISSNNIIIAKKSFICIYYAVYAVVTLKFQIHRCYAQPRFFMSLFWLKIARHRRKNTILQLKHNLKSQKKTSEISYRKIPSGNQNIGPILFVLSLHMQHSQKIFFQQ